MPFPIAGDRQAGSDIVVFVSARDKIVAGACRWLVIAGGIAYTVGAIVYGLKRPNPSPRWFGFHEIFHALTVAGFTCHYVAVSIATYGAG